MCELNLKLLITSYEFINSSSVMVFINNNFDYKKQFRALFYSNMSKF